MRRAPLQGIEIAAIVSVAACVALACALSLAGCDAGGPARADDGGGGTGVAGGTGMAGSGAAGTGATAGTGGSAAGGTGPAGAPARPDAGAAGTGVPPADAGVRDAGATDRSAPADASPVDTAAPDAGAPALAEPACKWPTPTGDQKVGATIGVSKVYDGAMKRFVGDGPLGSSGQLEGQPPLFQLASGATLRNVIIGSPAADGVHCAGPCTLENVWWEDVGEDAATLSGSSAAQVMTIDGGGARHAADKVFQHNGAGTMVIQNFCVEDFGKLYRSCGNCKTQYPRHAIIRNVSVTLPGGALAGVNENYGDSASFSGVFLHGGSLTICQRYTGNNTGAEPVQTGSGADGTYCVYKKTDVVSK